ncbi:MAG: diaminopimelate epimerase [Clostridia bacterium]|nr:diaminopimelate epimerase [Clostridia bacterium]
MRFTKMQGTGNDYIYVNCFEETVTDPASLAVQMSRPHFGAGADGLVLIQPCDEADFRMRIFNADGSESEMCGNATRCIGKYVYERGLTDKTSVTLMTGSGVKTLALDVQDGIVRSVCTDMGAPLFDPQLIPAALPAETALDVPLSAGGREWRVSCVSMGNPHCVVFTDDPETVDLPLWGPLLENHPVFPNRANVEFVAVTDRQHLRMRVWERGSGETLSCGSGACAALAAGVLTGRCDRSATMQLRGGELHLDWACADNHIYMQGGAEFVYDGEWLCG